MARADDPERFKALCRGRFKAMGLGAIIIAIALAWLVMNLLVIAADAALPAA
ncbi:hypothetical protein D3C81_2224340 [compost metagenome]